MKTNPHAILPTHLWWFIAVFLLIASIPSARMAHAQTRSTPLEVLDIAERTLDDAPALAILFSAPLNGRHRYDRYIAVTDENDNAVGGGWVLGQDKRVLYFPHVEPSKTYTVRVRRGLPAEAGGVVAEPTERIVKTRPMPPSYGFVSRGVVLPARLSDGLPIMVVNTPEIDVQFLRIKESKLSQFVNQFLRDARMSRWELSKLSPLAESVYLMRFTTGAKPNTRTVTHVPVEDIKELRQPGIYLAVMTAPGDFGYDAERIAHFYVSDIGLHARAYADGTDVYANSLATGRALVDIDVEVLDAHGKSVEKVRTDNNGVARFIGQPQSNQVLVARAGQHFSLVAFREPALDLSEFDVAGRPSTPLSAFVYADRDLYRPGETAHVSALLRDEDGRPVAPQPLQAVLRRPDGKESATFTWQPQAHGFYQHRLALPADGQTGRWTLEVRADPAAKVPVGILSLNVEEFLPERMKLDLASTQANLRHDQEFKIDAQGAYLYGAPASGNRFTAVMNVRREPSPVTGLIDFVFGDVDDDASNRREELPELTLNDKGYGTFGVKPFTDRPKSPMLVRVSGSLYETGGRPVVRSIQRVVWPAAAMIGVRPLWLGKYAPYNSSVRLEVVRANAEGRLLAGKDLDIKVIREDRHYYWSYDNQRGWYYEHSESQYPVYRQSLDIPAGKRRELTFPVEWGSYRVEIFDPETGLTARYRFQAGWDWNNPGQKSARPDRVVLKLDKPAYSAGDTAKVTIIPPHAGEAVVLVESDKALWSTRLAVQPSGTTVTIPISEDWARHDLYISTVVFRPAEAKQRITPNRAMGVIHLPLDRADRKLVVTVDAVKKIRPNEPLKVKLTLPDLKGREAMATLAAVDVGILNITDFKTPDAHSYFFSKRRYGAEAYDLYGKVIESLKGTRAKQKYGGDADTSALRKDKRGKAEVKMVALFNGPIWVDTDGHAEIELALPDFNGTLRLMAVAFTADRFGSSQTEVVVASPVIAEIATPRFLASGDRSTLTLDVQNMSGEKQDLHVLLSATSPLLLAPIDTRVTLDHQQKRTLQYELRADQNFGVGIIELRIEGKDITINRRWELGVRPAWPGERRVRQEILKPGATLSLREDLAAGLMDQTVEAQVLISSTPPINVRSAVKNLLLYPYGCLEQTTSTAYPHVYIDEAKAKDLGLTPLTFAERSERIAVAIQRLSTMQLASGGFSYWGNNDTDEPWLTPYVTGFLLDASEQGFAVPAAMLKRALDNMHRRLLAGGSLTRLVRYSESPAHLSFAGDAYAAYVLARVQRAPLGALRTLYDHRRKDAESGLPLVHLGLALKLMGDETRALSAIREGVIKERRERWYLGDYGTDVRDIALMVALLHRHQITVDGREKLLFTLGTQLPNRPYLSTQERFALFLAGDSLSKDAGHSWTGVLARGSDQKPLVSSNRLVRVFNREDLEHGISITTDEGPTLYAEIEITGYPNEAPSPKLDEIAIERNLYTPDGNPLGERALKVGEIILTHLRVRSGQNIEDGLVVDLLPAGLEVENLNISKGESLKDMRIDAINPLEAMQSTAVKHQEYRDDRFVAAVRIPSYGAVNLFYLLRVVSPGTYIVPAPFVEDMYRPQIHGIGAVPATIRVENVSS